MKSWQLYDVNCNNVIAESNDDMELYIIRDELIKNKNRTAIVRPSVYCQQNKISNKK